MKKAFKLLLSAATAAVLSLTCAITVLAETDTSSYVSKDEIIEELWGQYWDTNDTDPTTFPESSWDYYIVTGWLDRNYGNYELVDKIPNSSFCDWSKLSDIRSKYRDFYENLTENWDFDDEDGNWYINEYDPETEKVGSRLYHFNFNQGQWSMIDENGDTVYSFPPKTSYVEKENNDDDDDFHYDVGEYVVDPDTGELVEKENDTKVTTTNKTASADEEDNSNQAAQEEAGDNAAQGGARVTGKTENAPAVTSSDSSSESKTTSKVDENTESSTSPIVMVLCIIVVAGIVVIVILYLKRKKDENKK